MVEQAARAEFFPTLVTWQRQHGRSGLPWQGTRDPYRVWLSEIMLQQTQVSTVLGYFPRFLERFPDVQALAAAHLDEVLALWSGLGYYSRARNLHRCAQAVVAQWGGAFPAQATQLQTLPGIGPSTAAAIASFCFGERISIMDGNVKRVLTRLLAFDGDLAEAAQERLLWAKAQAMLPEAVTHDDMAAYTQGLMDLGATLCTRTKPQCLLCPAHGLCRASALQRQQDFPVKTKKLKRRTEEWWLMVLRRPDGAVWLTQRPAKGIWAGLFSMPVHASQDALTESLPPLLGQTEGKHHEALRHSLTHRELVLRPVEWLVPDNPCAQELANGRWVRTTADLGLGLPAPVRVWLEQRLPV